MFSRNEIEEIRKDFPYLNGDYPSKNIIYFDNAATTQKPIQVIEALSDFYKYENGNPHRSAHYLANKSTEIYDGGRKRVAKFINAKNSNEIIFTRNSTEGLNLLAYSWGLNNLKEGDEILLSIMEHHSNLVPWQFVAKKTGAKLVYLYLDENKEINMDAFKKAISKRTKLFTITTASNVLATMPNVKEMISYAKEQNPDIISIVDGAQYVPHNKTDVAELDCDFLVFSGHKMLSAYGIGVLYGKEEQLNKLEPFNYGGDMIEYVYEDRTTFLDAPGRFEAGTPNVGGVKSLIAAIDYLENIGMDRISEYESELLNYAENKIKEQKDIEIYTTPNKKRSSLLTFNFKEIHPHDVATILDSYGIAIRSGHHCAQPLHRYLGTNYSCRASFSFYNTFEEIDYFIEHLNDVRRMMSYGS